jgi:hypothetical protein
MLIDGERIPSVTGEYFDVQDPTTEELLNQAPLGNVEHQAVVFEKWLVKANE